MCRSVCLLDEILWSESVDLTILWEFEHKMNMHFLSIVIVQWLPILNKRTLEDARLLFTGKNKNKKNLTQGSHCLLQKRTPKKTRHKFICAGWCARDRLAQRRLFQHRKVQYSFFHQDNQGNRNPGRVCNPSSGSHSQQLCWQGCFNGAVLLQPLGLCLSAA